MPGKDWTILLCGEWAKLNTNRDEIRLWRDAALGSKGVELLACRCFDQRYRPHFHNELAIVAFNGGAQEHRVGRHRGIAVSGNVLIIPPGETHTAEAAEDRGWAYRAFYADGETVAQFAADLFAGSEHKAVEFDTAPLHDDNALCQRLVALHGLIEMNTEDPLARQQAFSEAMAAVLLRYARPTRTPRRLQPERRGICRAIDYANAHYTDPTLCAAELAAAACLSLYHFMRCFRATTGVTVHAFVIQLRIQEARRMLAKGLSAVEVADAVGFTDQSHLIRHFRTSLGVTPGQYARDTGKRGARWCKTNA